LLQLRAAVEIDLFDIDAFRFEEAFIEPYIERHEIERPRHGLADTELVVRVSERRTTHQSAPYQRQATHARIPPMF
jgi:hypothetical protein